MKLKIKPGFVIFAIIMLVLGQAYLFGVYIVSVLIHELAHYFISRKRGYTNSCIVISAFGAVLYGNYEQLDSSDELAIAIAGPMCSICISIVLVALWWVYPESYNWTSYAATANLSIGIFNLLPCYPLDGGRVLVALISKSKNHKRAVDITLLVGRIISFIVFIVFILSLFFTPNFSLGLFSVFLFAGNIKALDDSVYKKFVNFNIDAKLTKGLECRQLSVNSSTTLINVYRKLNSNYYYLIMLVENNEVVQCLTQYQFNQLLITNSYQTTIGQALKINDQT